MRRILLVPLLLALACDETTYAKGQPGLESGLTCDVDDVLTNVCQECHRARPRYGAPMSLVTLEDLRRPAVTEPNLSVYELIGQRIHDEDDPMPPDGDLTAAQLKALDDFIAADAPTRVGPAMCEAPVEDGGVVEEDAGDPDALPCTPSYEFRAFGEDGGKYDVTASPTGVQNEYRCFAFRTPFQDDEQATAWAPLIGDDRVVHHWILYQTETPQEEGTSFPCNALPTSDSVFLMGWAPGGGVSVLPDDVGLELPNSGDSWLLLQLHYSNAAGLTDLHDDTGVSICTTDHARQNTAGVLTVGTQEIEIPMRSVEHEVSYTCPGRVTQYLGEFTIMGSSPHMHTRGRSIRTEIVRQNGDLELVSEVPRWDFNDQQRFSIEPHMTIGRGDGVRVTCAYDNPTDAPITWGEGTSDEMCFDFMLVYPITQWPAGYPRYCVDLERFGF